MGFQPPPNPQNLDSVQRLSALVTFIYGDQGLNSRQLPGLANLLNEYASDDIKTPSKEDLIRRMIRVFKDSLTEASYSQVLKKYSAEEQQLLKRFVVDQEPASKVGQDFHIRLSPGAREEFEIHDTQSDGFIRGKQLSAKYHSTAGELSHHLRLADEDKSAANGTYSSVQPHPNFVVYDYPGNKLKVFAYFDQKFESWGRSVNNAPQITCVPTTSYGVQQVVKYAKACDMNVRASGHRHSWSAMSGNQGQVLISTPDAHKDFIMPNAEFQPGSEGGECPAELNSITFQGTPEVGKNRLVRVGTAVTSEQLRRWGTVQKGTVASKIPLNVSMVEVMLCGSHATICHGAGRKSPIPSDLVHAIEYVDANGNIQKLSKDTNPEGMKAAIGCFGLLGIITHITFELIPLTYAVMRPQKLHITETIPLPPEMTTEDLPHALRPATPTTDDQRAKAQAIFEAKARNSFYAEWLWYPYTSKVWVNCWDATDDPEGEVKYLSDTLGVIQWFQAVLAQIMQVSEAIQGLQLKFAWAQVTLMSTCSLYVMPEITDEQPTIKTQLPNALHFRRATQKIPVLETEMEIPLLPKSGVPLSEVRLRYEIDFSNVQRAWWAAVLTAYKYHDTCPQRMPLKMRITGPSQVIMAPFRGHNLGSASIEIQTLENMRGQLWQDYAQEILDHWMDLKDSRGEYLTTRPHWDKEWYNFKVRGQPMIDYVRQSYAHEIQEFVFRLGQIAKKQGWSMDEARRRFGNDGLNMLLFSTQRVTSLSSRRSQAHKQERSFITSTPVIIIN